MKNERQNERMTNGQQIQGFQNISLTKVKITCRANTPPEVILAMFEPSDKWQGTKGSNNTLQIHITGKAPPGHY